MALLRCPECGRQVSSHAEQCPGCGCPISATPDVVGGRQVRTIEKTAKRFKGQMLLATLLLLAGVIWIVIEAQGENITPLSIGVTVFAVVWLCLVKLLAWWHHG